jgi:predicted amidohydrolase
MYQYVVMIFSLVCVIIAVPSSDLVVRVALLQMMPAKNNDTANVEKAVNFCRKAKQQYNADIALMPEMWSVGYEYDYPGYNRNNPSGHNAWLARAVAENSSYVETFRKLAKELSMAIGVTYLQQYKPLPRNVLSIIGIIFLIHVLLHFYR